MNIEIDRCIYSHKYKDRKVYSMTDNSMLSNK